jgi:transposase
MDYPHRFAPWGYMPNDLPPWEVVYQRSRRWLDAGVFEAMTADLRRILRVLDGRAEEPSAVLFDSRTLHGTRPRAADAPATTGPNAREARKSTSRSTRSATCWRCG